MQNQVIDQFFAKWERETNEWFKEVQEIYFNDYDRYKEEIRPTISKVIHNIISGCNEEMIAELVAKDMAQKKADLVSKVGKKVGAITRIDVHCGEDGTPNGTVEGTKGKVRITTIQAGGYNIQCAHYRVLVIPVK